jgi:hypothetical protein
MELTPVTLPPGPLKLATKPILMGSTPPAKMIGMVAVAVLAASAAGVVLAVITATPRRTKPQKLSHQWAQGVYVEADLLILLSQKVAADPN